ncbi:hypothetical protein ACFPER_05785 [Agromyces aurantiacus]|uniref:Uncharacterized protein n=1 Tax=Agromyces aurantiacus TaxID=165814 RepID=A0ABV9R7H9_9MICO|nr:hypothetical protein [Agromyces aurantiacus]MBM7502969.1 hypothetical protein [Agromyces aurantiacus]
MTRSPHHAPFAGRHARAGSAFLAVAVILAATSVSVGLTIDGVASSWWRSLLTVATDVLGLAAVWVALPLGVFLLLTAGTPRPARRAAAIAAAVAAPILAEWSGAARSPFLILLALAAAVGGYAIVVLGLTEHRRDARRPSTVAAVAVVLGVANLAVIALGILHLLVWNPLARVPGLELAEIYTALDARGGIDGGPVLWALAALLVTVAAGALAVVGGRRGTVTPHQAVTGGLLLIHATSFFLWWAGFGLALEIADAFGLSGGDASPVGSLLALVGAGCLAAAILMQLGPPAAETEDDEDDELDRDDGIDEVDALPSAVAPVAPAVATS